MSLREKAMATVPALMLSVTGCAEGECPMDTDTLSRVSEYYGGKYEKCVDGVGYDKVEANVRIGSLVRGGYPETGLKAVFPTDLHCEAVEGGYVPEFVLHVEDNSGNVWVGHWDSETATLSFQ